MTRRFTKDDIEFHVVGYGGSALPAVNVKVYAPLDGVPLPLEFGSWSDDGGKTFHNAVSDPGFDRDWIDAYLEENDSRFEGAWQWAIEDGWEQVVDEAHEVLGAVEVWGEGRQGGWAVVKGLPDVEHWDAIMVSRWGRFSRYAKAIAADTPRRILDLIYANVYEPAHTAWQELDTVRDWRTAVALHDAARDLFIGSDDG